MHFNFDTAGIQKLVNHFRSKIIILLSEYKIGFLVTGEKQIFLWNDYTQNNNLILTNKLL